MIKKAFLPLFLVLALYLAGCAISNDTQNSVSMGDEMDKGMGNMSAMKAQNFDEKFSEITEGLPDLEPTIIKELKDGDTYELTAEIVKQKVGNRVIRRFAYNRQIPGPILKIARNAEITLKLKNMLEIPTTLHSHGIRMDNEFDGVPKDMGGAQNPIQPGETFTYKLKFPDEGIFWYHPHMREDYTQELGLYGNFLVQPSDDNYWNPVNREEFLVLDDFSENDPFFSNITNKTLMGRFGNIFLINNEENFNLEVDRGETVRFFMTNTANTRTFDIKIQGIKLKQVGGDVGRIEKEKFVDSIIIAPAERYVFEAQFNRVGEYSIEHRGQKLGNITVSNLSIKALKDFTVLRENISDYENIRENFDKFLAQAPDKKLRISIKMDMQMPGMMEEEQDEDTIEWEETMAEMNLMSNSETMEWLLIDEDTQKENMDMNDDWKFKKGDYVKISIFNDPESMHPMQHPIHFHGQRFLVLSRDGEPNGNLQWKDTVLVRKGEKVEILLEASNVGKWMSHCHIAEHLHAGMMFNFDVIE